MKLSEAWALYEADKRIEGYSEYTFKAYKIQLRLLIRNFGDVEIDSITAQQLKAYLAKDATRLKPASIGHRVRFIRSLWRWSHEEGVITTNAAAKLKEPKTGGRVPKALKEETIELLRIACKTPLEAALVEFMYTTGCRIGEVHRLNRNAINWANQSAIILGKGNKEREVYFTTRCAILLRRYLKSRDDNDMALIVTERRSQATSQPRRMSIPHIRYVLKRVAKRAGVEERVFPHAMRHSFATHLLNNGAPIEIIQSLLGHEKSDTTLLYTHLSGELRRQNYKRFF